MAQWELDGPQREDVTSRLAASMATMGWARGTPFGGEEARAAAVIIERKAYTVAQVGATVTTGARPLAETTKAYARKLSELLLDSIRAKGVVPAATAGGAGAAASRTEVVDLSAGGREFLSAEGAEEELKELLAPGATVSRIHFSTKSFGRDAALVAARGIANVAATLTDADISDVIAGRPEAEAMEALRILCGALAAAPLRRLNISDNALGEKGVRACAAAFAQQAGLQSISLQAVGCSIHACRALDELLVLSGELRQVHLLNNMTDNAGAEAIAKILLRAPLMEDFKIVSSRVGPAGGMALARGLSASVSLVRLDLSDNTLTAEVAPTLAACLSRQPLLRFLNLNDTSLTDKGVTVICTALAEPGCAPLLEGLELALNEITPKGAPAVALAMLGKARLAKVNVRENELTDAGVAILARALALLPALSEVDACTNEFGRTGALALAKAVAGRPLLRLLSLDDNAISEAGVEAVQKVLAAAGKAAALGPLDENDADGAGSDEEDEEEGGDDDLAAAMGNIAIA